jgi:ribose 5-phosphate isomerase A
VSRALAPLTPAVEAARDRAALAAAELVRDGMIVGLGTGDTSRRFIGCLGQRVKAERLAITCVASSEWAAKKGGEVGLAIRKLDDLARLDLAVDGADEVDPRLDLIKGAGGAHTREKIVASAAERFVIVVDESKLVDVLGESYAVPVEVVPEAAKVVTRRLAELGADPVLRPSPGGSGPWVTDLGNRIVDARFPRIPDPRTLAASLDGIPGVIEHGLFVGMAHVVLVGEVETQVVRRMTRNAAS